MGVRYSASKRRAFGLTSQLKRAAISINLNFEEGCGRETDSDFKRMLTIVSGSAFETEYALLLAKDLGYINEDKL